MNCTQVFFFLPKLTRPFLCSRVRFFSSLTQFKGVPLHRGFCFLSLILTKPIVARVILVCGPDGASIHDKILMWSLYVIFLFLLFLHFLDLFPLFFFLVLFLLCFLFMFSFSFLFLSFYLFNFLYLPFSIYFILFFLMFPFFCLAQISNTLKAN